MNCSDFQDLITAAVDSRVDDSVMTLFLEHAAACPRCRTSYEGERTVVQLVRSRIRPAAAPPEIVAGILRSIALEAASSSPAQREHASPIRWKPLLTWSAAAFALSFAAVVFILSRNGSESPLPVPGESAGSDIILQSVNAYQSVLKGDVPPQVASEFPDRVRSFFDGKTEFPVLVSAMKECTLVGGGLNEYQGTTLAHIVYKHGEQTISVYQACRETVMKGEKLHLPKAAREELARTGWYCGTTPDGASIVVWVKGATICAAVAPMKREHLMAHLMDAGDAGAW